MKMFSYASSFFIRLRTFWTTLGCVCVYIYIYVSERKMKRIQTNMLNKSYNIMPYNFWVDVCRLMAEQYDIKSNVNLGGFQSEFEASCVWPHWRVVIQWNSLFVDDKIYIYIYVWFDLVYFLPAFQLFVLCQNLIDVWLCDHNNNYIFSFHSNHLKKCSFLFI